MPSGFAKKPDRTFCADFILRHQRRWDFRQGTTTHLLENVDRMQQFACQGRIVLLVPSLGDWRGTTSGAWGRGIPPNSRASSGAFAKSFQKTTMSQAILDAAKTTPATFHGSSMSFFMRGADHRARVPIFRRLNRVGTKILIGEVGTRVGSAGLK